MVFLIIVHADILIISRSFKVGPT